MERYISFTVGDIAFIDSNQFMLSTLDKLCRNLNEKKFYETRKYLQNEFGGMPIFQFMFVFHLENYIKILCFIYLFISLYKLSAHATAMCFIP